MDFEAFLFDLDGTLLNFDPDAFVRTYLGTAAKFFIDIIPDSETFYSELLKSTDVMENNDNDENTTLTDFLEDFCPKFNIDCEKIQERFLQFYHTEFKVIKPLITEMSGAQKLLHDLRKYFPEKKLILATNPVFPFIAVKKRMEWGGVPEDVFELITHAENTNYCKNNQKYWIDIAKRTSINPKKSLMIGNDGYRDMVAKKYGYTTFLVETAFENEEKMTSDILPDFRGSLQDLYFTYFLITFTLNGNLFKRLIFFHLRNMSIIPPEASFIFAYLALLYNAGVSLKLVYNSLSNPRYHKKAWNLSSAGLILVGTVLLFFWFNFSLSDSFIWGGIIGSLLLFVNNLLATILAFRNSIEVSKFGKVNYIFFTVLALQSFMLLLNFIEAQTIFRLPGFLEWLMIIPTVGYSAFQAFLYGPVGYFYPALILIPIVAPIKFIKPPEPEPEPKKTTSKKSKKSKESVFTEEIIERPEEKKTPMWTTLLSFLDNGTKGIFAVLFILLFVFSLLNIGTFTSFSDFKGAQYNPVYPERSDFEFSVSLKTIYQQTLLTDYQEQFQEELILIKELNVSTVRIDVKAEIIDNNLTELVDITDQLHSNGFKIMMATYGYGFPTWNYQNVSLADFRDTIEQQAETLILNCSPEYLLIYPEPFGFSSAFIDVVPTPEEWGSTINSTFTYLNSLTNDTEIGVNLSFNDFEKFPTYNSTVFEELWFNTSLDFLGMDFYIIHGRDLDLSLYLNGVSTSTKDFWICEFGVSAVMYGERIQEAAVARLLEICTNDVLSAGNNTKIAGFKGTIKGLNYFSLIDDLSSGNSLGLVGESGHRRLSFYRYQEIIATVYA